MHVWKDQKLTKKEAGVGPFFNIIDGAVYTYTNQSICSFM